MQGLFRKEVVTRVPEAQRPRSGGGRSHVVGDVSLARRYEYRSLSSMGIAWRIEAQLVQLNVMPRQETDKQTICRIELSLAAGRVAARRTGRGKKKGQEIEPDVSRKRYENYLRSRLQPGLPG